MSANARLFQATAYFGRELEIPAAAPGVAATKTNTTTAIAVANSKTPNARAAPQSKYSCGIGSCPFQTATAKGIRDHQKNKHLGKHCYWRLPNNQLCGHTTRTHEELYEHFNQVHLREKARRGPPYRCCWPGNAAIEIPNGKPVGAEPPCGFSFQTLNSAERHAREHQHRIWRAMDNVMLPLT